MISETISSPRRKQLGDYELDIVVVMFNSWPTVSRELSQMLRISRSRSDIHWIFVDNSLDNGDSNQILERLQGDEHLTLHISNENTGFAAGSNKGASLGNAEWLFFLNPDISITESDLDIVINRLKKEDADTIAVGQVTRGFAHTGIGVTRYMWFKDRPSHGRMQLLGPSGGAGVYRRGLFCSHGGFYESLFAWGEDADLAFRLQKSGATCMPLELRLLHQGQHSVSDGRKSRAFKARLLTRNRVVVASRNYSHPKTVCFMAIHMLVLIMRSVENLRRGTLGASFAGYFDGLSFVLNKRLPIDGRSA